MKAVFVGNVVAAFVEPVRQQLETSWDIVHVGSDAADNVVQQELADADAMVCATIATDLPSMPRVRLLQFASAGLDGVDLGLVPREVTICNAFGHEDGMAEYVILAMLAWRHRFLELSSTFRDGSWAMSSVAGAPPHGEIAGAVVGIVGLGRIGESIGERAHALGMRVIACNRTPKERPAFVEVVRGLDGLDEMMADADFVVICCALTPETRGLIDARLLGCMKESGVLINVARGPIVDEDALFAALRTRRIGGAVLDVWYRYPGPVDRTPRPSKHPFHELDNVIMTPHSSGWTDGLFRRRGGQVAANLDRLARGEPLQNVVRAAPA